MSLQAFIAEDDLVADGMKSSDWTKFDGIILLEDIDDAALDLSDLTKVEENRYLVLLNRDTAPNLFKEQEWAQLDLIKGDYAKNINSLKPLWNSLDHIKDIKNEQSHA